MNPLSNSTSAPMCVLSIDPGATTGVVQAIFYENRIDLYPAQQPDTTVYWLWWTLQNLKPDHIICEDFEFRRNLAWAELFPVQLIGICNLYVQSTNGKTKLWIQKAAQGKSFYKDKQKIKDEGVYIPGEKFHHSMDAMRHFLYWYNFGAGGRYKKEELKFQLIKS